MMKIAKWGRERVFHDPSFMRFEVDVASIHRENGLSRADVEEGVYLFSAVALTGTDKRNVMVFDRFKDDVAEFADRLEIRALLKPFVDKVMRAGGWE